MKKHAEQVAAWGKLLGHCNALGNSYQPIMNSIKSAAMENLLDESVSQIEAVHNAETLLVNAISERQKAFSILPFIGTRVVKALEATAASPERVFDVNMIRKRFRYQALPKGVTALKATPGGQAGQTESAADPSPPAQRRTYGDFNSKIDNLRLLIFQLENGSPYQPAEKDISIEGLRQLLANLVARHEIVAQAQLQLYLAKAKRNELLYSRNGMYNLSKMVKKYILSVYGFKSIMFKTVSKIKFLE